MAPDDGTPTVSGSAPLGGGRLASDDAGSSDTPAEWLDLTGLEAEAPAVLPPDVGDHYAGGAGSEITLAEATAASAVWVSTHGGRPADPAVAAARALPEVVDAVGEDVEVYADGRIRSSSDVLTALALGATAVFVGRPVIWGLATGGTDGVSRVLTGLSGDLAHTMALCGLGEVRSVPRDIVTLSA